MTEPDYARYRIRIVMICGHEVPLHMREQIERDLRRFMDKKVAPWFHELDWKVI